MDIKLKHRLVGACVILALAVFFLPMILDSEKYNQNIQSQIPEGATLDIKPQSDSANEGSLTINLDEDEPEKAIQLPSENNQEQQSKESITPPDNNSSQQESAVEDADTQVAQEEPAQNTEDKSSQKTASTKQQSHVPDESSEKQSAQNDSAKTAEQTSDNPTAAEESATKQSQAVKKPDFTETSWVIQIGSFSNKDNASGLVSSLRNQGFRAYQRDAKEYTRVFVGPYPDEKAAKERTKALEKIVGAPVKVIAFDPQDH